MTPTSPTEIIELLSQGRAAYLLQNWDAALALDKQALALATAAGDAWILALCHRFVGLCHYRRGGAEALGLSERHLREAIALAERAGDTKLRLIVSNHLGATLRDLGGYDEAHDLFRAALREAVGPELVETRARLMGNLGALLDELEQRAGAGDCYARYEELLERLEDPRRLANARGLAGRAALQRGDLEEAQWRFTDELQRGVALDDRRLRGSALKHRAELALARLAREPATNPAAVARLATEAEQLLTEAWEASELAGDRKARVRVALKRAAFLRTQRRIAEAHAVLCEVWPLSDELDHPVLAPRLDQERAKVCASAGLHGESLWYLSRAARRRVAVVRGLKGGRVREMAHAWLDEVRAMATDLRAEAFLVPRGEAEREQFDELFAEIGSALGVELRSDPPRLVHDPWRWHDGLREQSHDRWACVLGEDFQRLHRDSQGDLVRADVTYHGAVDDLGRSAHLLAITLERELRERVLAPLRAVVQDNIGAFRRRSDWKGFFDRDGTPPSLATLLCMIDRAGAAGVRGYFEDALGSSAIKDLNPVVTLATPVLCVSGGSLSLVGVRNDVAHGRSPSTPLDRVAVDAIKRALTLDAPVVLKALLNWPPAR